MRAVVKFGRKDGEVEARELPGPEVPAGQILVRVKAAGVCGSDIHMWRETHSWTIKTPLILGHEFAGVVERSGPEAGGFRPGERVVCETAAQVCGRCAYCRTGDYNLCPERLGFGALVDGAMAECVAVRPAIAHRLPETASFECAALTEPVCVAVNALMEKTRIKPGDTVVIQGAGTIGVICLLVAKICGAGRVLVLGVGKDRDRLGVAKALGAFRALDIGREDPLEALKDIGDGLGADLVVDCAGVSSALKQAAGMVRPGGQIAKIGWGPQPLDFSLDPLVQKAVRLQFCFSHTWATWERAISLMGTGRLDLSPVIGGRYPLSDWEKAFSDMESGKNVKSVLTL